MASLPTFEAGCRMPTMRGIEMSEANFRAAAEIASERLLIALLRYGAKHGLPRMSTDECREKLWAKAPPPPPPPIQRAVTLRPAPKGPPREARYRRHVNDEWRPDEDRRALRLRLRGESFRAIASMMERTPDAVAARIRYLGQKGVDL